MIIFGIPVRNLKLLISHSEFVVLLAGNFILGSAYSLIMPFMSVFGTRELGLGPWGFGLFMTANALTGIVISTRIARWSDIRFSRKSVLIAGSLAGTAMYICFALVRNPWILLPISCLLGGIAGGTFSQTFALARDLLGRSGVAEKEIPFYINVFRIFFALSWTVGPAIGAMIVSRYSIAASFLAAAALFGAYTLLSWLGLTERPPTAQARMAAASMPMSQALRLPGFLAHFIAMTLMLCCSTMGMMNLTLLILGPLRGSESHVGVAYGIGPFFELPFMYYAGVLATRLQTSRIIRWSAILAVVYYVALSLAREPWHVYPLQVLSAALVAVTSGLAITFFQEFLPGQAGTATNVYGNAGRIGGTAGYLMFGWLGSAFGYRSVFAVCGALCGVAWLIMQRWPPRTAHVPVVDEGFPEPQAKAA
jgi:MFS transporter, SET family, sugar efflux transporter